MAVAGSLSRFGTRPNIRRAVTALAAVAGLAAAAAGLAPGSAGTAAARAATTGAGARVTSHQTRQAVPPPIAATEWPAYLGGPSHTSYNANQTAISPANAAKLTQRWQFVTGAPYLASPTIADNSVFIGASTGWFYKLNEFTGALEAKVFTGYQPSLTCPGSLGVASTATVARNPSGVLSVYVAGASGYLYALRASNLTLEWRAMVGRPSTTINNYYNWSSPTVAGDEVYMGIASDCDQPLVRGGVIAFRQSSGRKTGEFFTVPAGSKDAGGSVWSSIGIGPNGDVYATSGNGPAAEQRLGASEDVMRLSPVSLRLLAAFKVPRKQVTRDGDFGASPVFFDGMVGACNKNGIFYALNRTTMKLVWWKRIANASGATGECLVAPAYNGTDLFFGGSKTTVNGTAFPGSVQERLATTGALQWSTGMPGAVLGSPALDGAGLLTATVYRGDEPGVYLFDAATGQQVSELISGELAFGQAVFANGRLFCATASGVTAWAP